jgi:uncharacterized membrane protein
MYISTSLLNNTWEKYKKNKEAQRENYNDSSDNKCMSPVFMYFLLTIAIIFFILEVILITYAIIIAINCTKSGGERVVHIVLAVTFTLPYMLVMSVFNKCAQGVLRSESPLEYKYM